MEKELIINKEYSVITNGTRKSAISPFIHYAVGRKNGYVPDVVEVLNEYRYGYTALISDGIIYQLAEPEQIVSHASGFNRSHLGIAFAYYGPVAKKVKGWIEKDGLWYPPYNDCDIEIAAQYLKMLYEKGFLESLEPIYHEDVNPKKRDVGPAFNRRWFECLLK